MLIIEEDMLVCLQGYMKNLCYFPQFCYEPKLFLRSLFFSPKIESESESRSVMSDSLQPPGL